MGTRARALRRVGAVLLFVLALSSSAESRAPQLAAQSIRRTVIVLYSGPIGPAGMPHANAAPMQILVMPMNHLGMVVRPHHIDSGPPPSDWLKDTAAVVTWFVDETPLPDWVWPWLERHVPQDVARIVHLSSISPLQESDETRFQKWIAARGLRRLTQYVRGPARVAVEFKSDALCRFEGNSRRYATYDGVGGTEDAEHDVWIRTRPRADLDAPVGTPVLTASWGGLGLDPWMSHRGDAIDDNRWLVDPFAFFRDALGLRGIPVPAPEARNGRRVFFLHVDGDGFESVSLVDPPRRCGEVFVDRILEKYQIPCTMSVIVGSLSNTLNPTEPTAMMQAAKRMFALPYVEVASHGVLHPFTWTREYGADPDIRKHYGFVKVDGFTYSQYNEVAESVKFIRKYLVPAGKPCVGMLWTGNCLPSTPALEACRDLGVWNLNGGTYRWDPQFDSVAFVSPRERWIGEHHQVYACAANDNEFPGFFGSNPSAFEGVGVTIERTGSPRLLKPANVYAHFYSVERHARMKSLIRLLDRWAVRERTFVAPASLYVKAVQSAVTARITKTTDGWRLSNFGDCRTVRFDDPDIHIDWSQSTGVHGARRIDASLFVHLSAGDAQIVLDPRAPAHPHVYDANVILDEIDLASNHVTFTCASRLPREIVLAGFEPGQVVSVLIGGRETTSKSDADGHVVVHMPPGGPDAVEVRAP